MKKIFAIAIVLLLLFFTGCEATLNENGEMVFTDGGRFVVVEHNDETWGNTFENWIVKDSKTGVLYMLVEAGGTNDARIAMTVLMKPDGTPMTVEDWGK